MSSLHSKDRYSSTKLFHEKLSMLNDNLISFLKKEHAKKPHADLTPTLNDYFKHLRSLDEMYSTPVDANNSVNEFPPIPSLSEKSSGESTTTISCAPTFTFGSLATKSPLFGGVENGKDNATNNSVNKFPPIPSLFSLEKSSEESTTTTSSAPTFTFGSLATKSPLFGGFTSTVENGKDNDVNKNDRKRLRSLDEMSSTPVDANNSVNKFPPIPSLFSYEKSSGESTTTVSSAPTFTFGSLATKSPLFGGFTSTVENGKDNATTVNKFPPIPSLFSPEKSSGESTTTTSSAPTFTFGTSAIKPSLFGGFTSTVENGKDNDNEDDNENDDKPEEFVPTDNIQPIVPLPSKVETKSGEENEENLFEARCRLFRFDKEAKEYRGRGTGDIKILHNKQLNRYRCVARNNEALSKLLANFTIFVNFKVEKREEKPTCLIWRCKDSSENKEGTDETFLAKFRDEETAQKFIKKVEEIISTMK